MNRETVKLTIVKEDQNLETVEGMASKSTQKLKKKNMKLYSVHLVISESFILSCFAAS